MSDDSKYNRDIENATPLNDDDIHTTEKEYSFSYRQGIGELIYAMVTCRPDISFHLIKLSQYNPKPVKIKISSHPGDL